MLGLPVNVEIVKGAATGALMSAKVELDEPPDIYRLLRFFKIGLRYLSPSKMGGESFYLDKVRDGWLVTVATGLSPVVEMFGLGHELGHVYLDHPTSERKIEHEIEAKLFSASLLAPSRAVIKATKQFGYNPARLSAVLRCSPIMAALRVGEERLASIVVVFGQYREPLLRTESLWMPLEELRTIASGDVVVPDGCFVFQLKENWWWSAVFVS